MQVLIKYTKYIAHILIWILSFSLLIFLTKNLLPILLPFILGWIIASICNPLVNFLEKNIFIKRKFSSVLIVLLVLFSIVGIFYYSVIKILNEINTLSYQLPYITESITRYFNSIQTNIQNLFSKIPPQYKHKIIESLDNFSEHILLYAQEFFKTFAERVSNIAKSFPSIFITILMTLFCAYIMISEREKIKKYISQIIPENVKIFIKKYSPSFKGIISGYFWAQIKIMFLIFIILVTGFLFLNVNYAMPIALLIAFLDFLPLLGTGFVIWPWTLFEFLGGNYKMAVSLIIIYAITQLFRRIIEPKILGDTIGLNPVIAIILMFIGYKISSVFGLILAVPIGMLFINLKNSGLFDDLIFIIQDLYNDILTFINISKYKKD